MKYFVLDVQVYYLLANVYSHLGEPELARQYAELTKTATIPIQTGLEISSFRGVDENAQSHPTTSR